MSGLKIEFIDNSDKQYEGSADEVTGISLKGRLFIGDRDAASFLQLRHRKITHVINCEKDIHGSSKEKDVTYLNIDPESDDGKCFDKAYTFLEEELSEKNNNILIHCLSGNGRSCGIILYYLMKKLSISLANAHRQLKKIRVRIQLRGDLVKLLIREEKRLRPSFGESVALSETRQIVYLDGADSVFSGMDAKKGSKKRSNTGAMLCGALLVVFLIVLYFGLDVLIKAGKPLAMPTPSTTRPQAKAHTGKKSSSSSQFKKRNKR